MAHHIYGIGLVGIHGLLVGCAYPSLSMGNAENGGVSHATGGAPTTALGSGGAVTTVSSSGGAVTTVSSSGGAVTTVSSSGGAVVVTPSSGGTMIVTSNSGGTTSTAKGGSVSSGGIVTTGGSTSAAGAAGAPAECLNTTNLIALAMTNSTTGNWVGNDPAIASDNPCGVQGAIYAYSDDGLDGIAGGTDSTVQSPGIDTTSSIAGARLSPCSGGKCCISGKTTLWPLLGGLEDFTASVWGGGMGLDLNLDGSNTKFPYPGPAKGFSITLSGSLNGQVVRFHYLQSAKDVAAPFKEVRTLGTYEVLFTGVACAIWDSACTTPGIHPYGLEIQIVGGDWAGAYNLCIDSVTPIL